MFLRAAMLIIPVVAVMVSGLVFLGPARPRPVIVPKIWGVPAEGSKHISVRIETIVQAGGIAETTPLDDLVLSLPGHALAPWQGGTGPDGIADLRLETEVELYGRIPVRLSRGRDVLIDDAIELHPYRAKFAEPKVLPAQTKGAGQTLRTRSGHLVAGLPNELELLLEGVDRPEEISTTCEVAGGKVEPATAHPDRNGVVSFSVTATDLSLQLSCETRFLDPTRQPAEAELTIPFEQALMVLSSASTHPDRVDLEIVSPTPRERAYVSLHDAKGRIAGDIIPLTMEGGYARGRASLPLASSSTELAAILSGDPLEQSMGTAAWPIVPAAGSPGIRPLELLIDGTQPALRKERARAWLVKRNTLVLLLLAGVAEVLLLLQQSRRAQLALEKHLRTAGEEDLSAEDQEQVVASGREVGKLVAIGLSLLVLLGFGALAVLTLSR